MMVGGAFRAIVLLMILASVVIASSRVDPNVGTSCVEDDLVSLIRLAYPNLADILRILEVVKLDIVGLLSR